MRILLTGANGYIGSTLLPALAERGHHVIALVRSASRIHIAPHLSSRVTIVEADLLKPETLQSIPETIDAAYYLVHSMSQQASGFSDAEAACAENFVKAVNNTQCKQIIYLGGLAKKESVSEHMASRRHVETILRTGQVPVTVLRAGIIIGAGSASFEIIRDLVEKLPVMIAPRWVQSRCQPIAIADVAYYLQAVLNNPKALDQTFEIGGPETLTYREMLMRFAKARGLKRWIIQVPVLTPRLSSYWLFFITSTNFSIARALVDSLKIDAVCGHDAIDKAIPHKCLTYDQALERAFSKIHQNAVLSSWKDALGQSDLNPDLNDYIEVPTHGCLKEVIELPYTSRTAAMNTLWQIGGRNGWYYMDWAWKIRGIMDQIVGGIGLRRGRTHPSNLKIGDALDFWRVLLADRKQGHLLLFAEMKVPGEAWLEYRFEGDEDGGTVTQTATFRPRGLLGRLYWYMMMPAHHFIFYGLCNAIATGRGKRK